MAGEDLRFPGISGTVFRSLAATPPSRGFIHRLGVYFGAVGAGMFHESEKSQWTQFVEHGPVVNEKLHNYSRLTHAIAQAHKEGSSLDQAIEAVFSWEALERESQEAARLAKPLESSQLAHFRSHFSQFRHYAPKFLEAPVRRDPGSEALDECH